jgi:hypothetical protein
MSDAVEKDTATELPVNPVNVEVNLEFSKPNREQLALDNDEYIQLVRDSLNALVLC